MRSSFEGFELAEDKALGLKKNSLDMRYRVQCWASVAFSNNLLYDNDLNKNIRWPTCYILPSSIGS